MFDSKVDLGTVAGEMTVRFADAELGRRFSKAFGGMAPAPGAKQSMSVARKGSGYAVQHADGSCIDAADEASAVGVVDVVFERTLRGALPSNACSVHSCGVVFNGHAVALVGVSGSGKTTLGLAAAMGGADYMGDEFGYLDLSSGMYWHEPYPIMTKAGTAQVLGLRYGDPFVAVAAIHSCLRG